MSDKAQISSDYLQATKDKYLVNTDVPSPLDRRCVVLGTAYGNIGQQIAYTLQHRMGYSVKTYTETEVLASEVSSIPNISKTDTIVFNNGETHLDWMEDQPEEKIVSVIQNTLTETIIGTGQFVQATKDLNCKKNIVFVGSMAYKSVLNGSAPYCAAKAGLAMFARCMAWELAPKNYNVFIVHPSNVEDSPMSDKTIQDLARYRGISLQEAEAYWSASLPREDWLQKEDIANMVARLVSGEMGYASGSQIELAGGQR